jgi:phosphotransferase system enzyme I (PtsI)
VRSLRAAWSDPAARGPDILTAQLDALAASESDVERADAWVMAPMVATAEGAVWFVERACRPGLGTAGVMVEVPPSRCAPPTSLAKSTSSA